MARGDYEVKSAWKTAFLELLQVSLAVQNDTLIVGNPADRLLRRFRRVREWLAA